MIKGDYHRIMCEESNLIIFEDPEFGMKSIKSISDEYIGVIGKYLLEVKSEINPAINKIITSKWCFNSTSN